MTEINEVNEFPRSEPRFTKQPTGSNFCLLFSVLMALPTDAERCAFTQCADPFNLDRFFIWYNSKNFNNPNYMYGFMSTDIANYLKFLESNGLISSFFYKTRRNMHLDDLFRVGNTERNTSYLVLGNGTSNSDIRNRVARQMAENMPAYHADRKRMANKLAKPVVGATKKRSSYPWGIKRLSDFTCHAVSIRVGAKGIKVLLDPGKQVAKRFSTLAEFCKGFPPSLFDYYQVIEFNIKLV